MGCCRSWSCELEEVAACLLQKISPLGGRDGARHKNLAVSNHGGREKTAAVAVAVVAIAAAADSVGYSHDRPGEAETALAAQEYQIADRDIRRGGPRSLHLESVQDTAPKALDIARWQLNEVQARVCCTRAADYGTG